jgi:hypothetical protein
MKGVEHPKSGTHITTQRRHRHPKSENQMTMDGKRCKNTMDAPKDPYDLPCATRLRPEGNHGRPEMWRKMRYPSMSCV